MEGNRQYRRDDRGRFAARPGDGTELKRGRGDRVRGRPQIRQKHKRALTRAEIERFLTILARTCNVSMAARETERSARVYYDLRRREPGFRADWGEALREGYESLELELVERCRFGTPRDVFYQGRKTGVTRVFNDATALRLLHFHRKTIEAMRAADGEHAPDAKAIFDALAARVAQIKAEAAAKSGETDGDAA